MENTKTRNKFKYQKCNEGNMGKWKNKKKKERQGEKLEEIVTTQSGGITTKTRKNTEDCNHETHEKHETYERYGTFF